LVVVVVVLRMGKLLIAFPISRDGDKKLAYDKREQTKNIFPVMVNFEKQHTEISSTLLVITNILQNLQSFLRF